MAMVIPGNRRTPLPEMCIRDRYKAEVDRWGYIDPSRWDAFYQWLWENQLIEEEIPAGFGFSNDYLPE